MLRVYDDEYARAVKPRFLTVRPDGGWQGSPTDLRGRCDGVAFEATGRWWGTRWTVISEAPFPVPEPLLLFASSRGMEHGFWRDFRIGDPGFDREHFVFSDTPALLPFIVGPATRAALAAGTKVDDALTLYVRGGVSRLTGTNEAGDASVIERHLAVHHALAADHQTALKAWEELVGTVHGRAEPRWPPTARVINPVGVLRLYLRWDAGGSRDVDWSQREDSLRTSMAGHGEQGRPRWSMREAEPFEPHNLEIKDRRFVLDGKPAVPLAVLEPMIHRTQITRLACGNEARVSVRGLATTQQLTQMIRTLELLLKVPESGSPYR
ncbi:hypothetical protein BH11MYX3_BH11MYX3_02120 [soil metagenome]